MVETRDALSWSLNSYKKIKRLLFGLPAVLDDCSAWNQGILDYGYDSALDEVSVGFSRGFLYIITVNNLQQHEGGC